jgi:hypothetical protein
MNWSKEWGKPQAIKNWKPNDPVPVDGEKLEIIIDEDIKANEAMKALGVLPLFESTEREAFINKIYKITNIKLGNKSISVIVVGDLGLDFCEPGEKDEGWNIYHLPTLACFSSAVPCKFEHKAIDGYDYDKQPLLNWMTRVQENYPTSWQMLRLLTPDTYQDNGASPKEIIQKWCLSVKVE